MATTDVNPWGKQDKLSKKVGSHSSSVKLSKMISHKLEKTKVAAASGAKKIKAGATAGVKWLKIKYHARKLAKRNK